MLCTNTHIHTPYSFSPFESIERIVASAKEEGIAALGINDVFTCDGFAEFAENCRHFDVYPIFNMEFLVRQEDIRTDKFFRNAPADRGFLFLCGKALKHPLTLSADNQNLLIASWKKNQDPEEPYAHFIRMAFLLNRQVILRDLTPSISI